MKRTLLGLILSSLVHPVNYGERAPQVQKAALYRVKQTLPALAPDKVIHSPNILSQKSRRRRAKWGNKK